MELKTVKIEKPADCNIILGQTHFLKTVEDLFEVMVTAVPNIKFGLAFCESSGECLVRSEGTDKELQRVAEKNALELSTGHTFLIILGKGFYPINVLNVIKNVPEVCSIFAATANPLEVIIAETEQGRGILGVIDGLKSKGVEKPEDAKKRKEFLRQIGYKL
jgi:hypothetical protein